MEAQKLKKKLNGSILKGSKIRIEDAKPEKRKVDEKDEASAVEQEDRPAKRAKKEKKKEKDGVLSGFELPDTRKVKRGWTDPPVQGKAKTDKKDKRERAKESKYTKEPEMLFRTRLTPVAAAAASVEKVEKSKNKKSKASRDVVVHEFSKTTKHASFLKSNQVSGTSKPATEYVDGKGWVDEDGNVVEAETVKARRSRVLELAEAPKEGAQADVLRTDEEASSSDEDASETDAPAKVEDLRNKANSKLKNTLKSTKPITTPPTDSESMTSSSDEISVVSSSSESDSESESASQASSSSISSTPTRPLQNITITPASPSETKEIHPLEALFKRPQPPMLSITPSATPTRLAPINTSFSFFGGENAEDDIDTAVNPPHTPFTRQDLQWRGLRSAAPTPDTAAIGGRFAFPWENSNEEEEDAEAGSELNDNTKANSATHAYDGEDENEDGDVGMVEANSTPLGTRALRSGISPLGAEGEDDGEGEESAFAKWFWEHRGENNRAWKKRRREALKVKRQRENRRLGRKVV